MPGDTPDVPVTQMGAVQNPPQTEGGAEPVPNPTVPATQPAPTPPAPTPPAPDPVKALVDAANGADGWTPGPGPAMVRGEPPAPAAGEPPAEPPPGEPPPAEPPAQPSSFAELAEEERRIRQQGRALQMRQEQLRQREAELEQSGRPLSREERIEQLRADPAGYLQREYGLGLEGLADVVAGQVTGQPPQGAVTPEVAQLREQVAQLTETLNGYQQQQTEAMSQAQHQAAVAGIATGLDGAKESYPLLLGMLGRDQAAAAIVQGVQQSYTAEGFKTADEVAAELEANLQPIAQRLIAAQQPPKPAEPTHPSPEPTWSPRLTNQSTATPATPQKPLSRAEQVEQAAAALRFVGE